MTKAEQSMTTGAEVRAMTDSAQQVRVEQVDREAVLLTAAEAESKPAAMDGEVERLREVLARGRAVARSTDYTLATLTNDPRHSAALTGLRLWADEVDTILAAIPNPIEPRADAPRPITMQDVRLFAGEGDLSAQTVLDAVNAVLRQRARAV